MTAFGAIEAGGTKFVCAIGTGPNDLRTIRRIPTSTPTETIPLVTGVFTSYQKRHHDLAAIGVGTFGPVDCLPASPTFGFIKKTPKPGWSNTDLVGAIRAAVHLPVVIESDVNAAAFGEYVFGAGRGLDNVVYFNVGTGIGGGAIINGTILRSTEMGHMRIPHDRAIDQFDGSCIFHGDCLEGLASGAALRQRWGCPAENLPSDHPGWALEAEYLSSGIVNVVSVLSPQRVILGGGVAQQPHLLSLVRINVVRQLGGYLGAVESEEAAHHFIVKPHLLDNSGIMGALAMARTDRENKRVHTV